jgi:hypothetical protein
MLFEDPIGTIRVELPSGWTYDPFDSTLTDFYFTPWDRGGELVMVHVRPSLIAPEQPDEEWIARVRSEVGDRASLTAMDCSRGPAVAAEFTSGKNAQRVVFIRGPRVELVIEQRCTITESPDPWAALHQAVETVFSAVNQNAPEECGADEFNRHIEAANQAFERKEFSAVADALQQALQAGTSAWLYSLAPPVNAPEIHAAVRVAQAMMQLAGFTGNPFLRRDSELVLRRALRALESVGPTSHSTHELMTEISNALEGIALEILEGTEEKASGSISPILAMRERGFRSAQAAARALESADYESAYCLAGLALEDLLALVAYVRRSQLQDVPQEVADHLAGQGITEPAAQREAMQKARESTLFPALNQSLQIRWCSAMERGGSGASEAMDILRPLAEHLAQNNPGDIGISMNLALAMVDCAGVLVLQDGVGSIDDAEQCLGKATQITESVKALHCPDDGWIRYHGQQCKITLQAFDQRLTEAGAKKDSAFAGRLKALRSQLENLAGQFREKTGAAAVPHNAT